jgi:hypothetical protein
MAAGRRAEAETMLRQAHEIFVRAGAPEAAEVAAEVEARASTSSSAEDPTDHPERRRVT